MSWSTEGELQMLAQASRGSNDTSRRLQEGAVGWTPPTIEVPEMVVGTLIGRMLVDRMVRSMWEPLPWATLSEEWRRAAHEGCSKGDLLQAQSKLGTKRSARTEGAKCLGCGVAMAKGEYRKCSTCLGAKYCSKRCQRRHWATHREYCCPPTPIIGSHVVVCVPDYKCFWDYIDWATLQGAEQVGLMVQSRSEFNEQHSKATCMRTVLTLATKGHPELAMSMVMGGEKRSQFLETGERAVLVQQGGPCSARSKSMLLGPCIQHKGSLPSLATARGSADREVERGVS